VAAADDTESSGSAPLQARPAGPVELAQGRYLLAAARRIVVLTGAGISTDSGIPDFRGPNGLWTKNPEAEKLATIGVYRSDPDARRRAWAKRLDTAMWQRRPNPGHLALVDLEAEGRLELVITQNVDGLHRAAGTDPDRLVEVHGNVREVVCLTCGDRTPMPDTAARVEAGEQDPPCVECGGILKPAVVFFGEGLDPDDLERAFAAAEACDLFLVVGSSLTVYPINETVTAAVAAGAQLVIVNGEPTPFDRAADVVLRGAISEVLPTIVGGWPGAAAEPLGNSRPIG
jgi:NAD-dependent deacetylase